MKELKDMTAEELRSLSSEANRVASEIEKKSWEEPNKFWKDFKYEYEFRAVQIPVEKEAYYRDKKIEKAVLVEARYTEDTISRIKEGIERFDGRGPISSDYKENKWQGMDYYLVEGQIVASASGGSVWLETLWKDGDWNDKETYFKRLRRLFRIEEWLANNPSMDEDTILGWKEINPWQK